MRRWTSPIAPSPRPARRSARRSTVVEGCGRADGGDQAAAISVRADARRLILNAEMASHLRAPDHQRQGERTGRPAADRRTEGEPRRPGQGLPESDAHPPADPGGVLAAVRRGRRAARSRAPGPARRGPRQSLDTAGFTPPQGTAPGFQGIIQAGNLAGLPALVLPCGFADNLPVALQLVGVPFSENRRWRSAASSSRAPTGTSAGRG